MDFLSQVPKGLYKKTLSTYFKGDDLSKETKSEIVEDLLWLNKNPTDSVGCYNYISSVEEYFDLWVDAYKKLQDTRKGYLTRSGKGFELQLPSLDVQEERTLNRLEGEVLTSDLNSLYGDFDGYLFLVVNDFDEKKVLSYKEKQKEIFTQENTMKLEPRAITNYEVKNFPVHEFPFSSLNPNKTLKYTWNLIGIEPGEVYEKLRKIGFVF